MLQPIIIAVHYTNEKGEQESRYKGYLMGDLHAMYVENTCELHRIMFVIVVPTEDPDVFLDETIWCPLGILHESLDAETVIEALSNKLHSMTAYEFMKQVIVHVKQEIGFEDWIIPKLIE